MARNVIEIVTFVDVFVCVGDNGTCWVRGIFPMEANYLRAAAARYYRYWIFPFRECCSALKKTTFNRSMWRGYQLTHNFAIDLSGDSNLDAITLQNVQCLPKLNAQIFIACQLISQKHLLCSSYWWILRLLIIFSDDFLPRISFWRCFHDESSIIINSLLRNLSRSVITKRNNFILPSPVTCCYTTRRFLFTIEHTNRVMVDASGLKWVNI